MEKEAVNKKTTDTANTVRLIRSQLLSMAEPEYKAFQSKLIPTMEPDRIIGIRTPLLRKYAKALTRDHKQAEEFLDSLPHSYYEENNLHGFLLETIKDYDQCICRLEAFLPFVDNWATCDGTVPKVLKKYPERTLKKAGEWIKSSHTYTCRYGIKVLMDSYLEENFCENILAMAAAVDSEEYYVRMMQAWFFATALAKQYETVLPYLKERCLNTWVHNKTIQKARESYRITAEQKQELQALKLPLPKAKESE
ncbi:MAG: DNA alkylation repair protein [Lachnospiraceae bacterium]|nr:DNA alkylation repair protein [Lachnospiraceae bacterium]